MWPSLHQHPPVPTCSPLSGDRRSGGFHPSHNLKLLSTHVPQIVFNRFIFPSQLFACKEHHPQRHEIQQYPLMVASFVQF